MTQTKVQEAMRFIEAFLALLLGKRVPVQWGSQAKLSSAGGMTLPRPVTGDAAEVALLTRLAMHEAGHAEETEFGFAQRLSPEEISVFNVLEDPRMEAARCEKYPGAAIILSRGLDELMQTLHGNVQSGQGSQVEPWKIDLLLRGFLAAAPHAPIRQHAPAILAALEPQVTSQQRLAIGQAIVQIPTLATSRECEALASTIVAQMRVVEPPPPPEAGDDDEKQPPDGKDDDVADAQDADSPQAPQDAGGEVEAVASQPDDDAPANPSATESSEKPSTTDEPTGESANEGASQDAGADSQADAADASGGGPPQLSGEGQPEPNPGKPGDASEGDSSNDGSPGEGSQPGSPSADAGQAGAQGDPTEIAAGAPEGDGPTGAEFDLGSLLREVLVQRYGEAAGGDEAEAASPAPDEGETERLAGVLADAQLDEPLENLLERSLIALEQAEPMEQDGNGQSAGMSLAPGSGNGLPIETRLQGVQSRLAMVLQRELQERRRRPTKLAHAGNRIVASRFWRLERLGDTKVFAERHPASGIDCAASIIVDSSLSTKPFLQVSLEIALAFSLALQRLGVHTKVVHFPAVETVTGTLQRFGESARSCVKRASGLSAGGGTPIGAAAATELPLLLEQRKLKHVMLFITDDDPGDPDLLRAALRSAEEQGVMVLGVGIGCGIQQYIPHSVTVATAAEVPQALAQLFRENISVTLTA